MGKDLNSITPLKNISVETLKSAFEASRSPVIITDYSLPDNPIIYSNQAFLDLTGYSMPEVIGRNCRFLQGDDTDKAAIRELHDAVANGKHARTLLKNYTKDGTEFYNDLLISPIHDKDGTLTHFLGMQLDVTERVHYRLRLEQKTRELEDSNRELEQFTYAASHDLQEPLRMISSYLQLINKRYGSTLDEDGKTFLGFANEGAERLQTLIYDLLALSRISIADDLYVKTDIGRIVDRATDNLKVSIRESGAAITVGPMPEIEVDPSQITQLIQNLVANAIKYRNPA